MVRIAVLGCGRIGRMHAANIAAHPRAALAGVFDVHRPAAEDVAAALDAPVFDSAEAVFASPDVDAVLIASSTPTHSDLLEAAVAAGKPVLCEKPIDLSLARVNAVRGAHPRHRACRSCSASCAASIPAIAPWRRRSATGSSATCTRWRSPRAIPAWRRSAISRSRAASSGT